ncbi:MAG: type II toxin-antitoxin system HipA family toxin [Planctomycetota bacterium]
MAERLRVFFGDRLVGELHPLGGGRLAFEYSGSWLEDERSFAISMSLPLAPGRNSGQPAQAFFANLLPEGQLREAVARQLGLSASNDYALLEAIGGECAGALTILPEGASPDPSGGSYERLAPDAIAQMARRYAVLAEVTGRRAPRLSLAGAQDKLPVRLDKQGGFWLPVGGAPSTHILKVPSRDFKHLPANEALITALGGALSLAVVDVELIRIEEVEIAVVGRYDRVVADDGKTITRLHQEDLCQALGLLPGTKYEQEGGPGFADVMRVVRNRSTEPLADAQQLLSWIAFVLLAGNCDGHGKNLSILYSVEGRDTRLAPFYDLVCTRVYPRLDRFLAMGVGGERDPGQIGRAHWEALGRSVGVGHRMVMREVERLATSKPAVFEEVAGKHVAAHGNSPVIQRIRQVIRKQCRRSLELLRQ